jgi:hypothetical protein
VIPSAGTSIAGLRRGLLTDTDKLQLCQTVFVNFRNYVDENDAPVPNTLEARLELADVSAVFYAIQAKVLEVQNEIISGEGSAASD